MDFIVVNVPRPYNAILGRAWIHAMESVASTYHQVVRFIGASGHQEDIFGDQAASKKCYISVVKESREIKQVQWVEVPDALVLEDVGASPDERVVEEVVKLPADTRATILSAWAPGSPRPARMPPTAFSGTTSRSLPGLLMRCRGSILRSFPIL